MATYYKYKSREGEDQIDWRGITKGITDDITRIAGEREEQRVEIDKAVLTNLETLADKPQGQDAGHCQLCRTSLSYCFRKPKAFKIGSYHFKRVYCAD